ncbi:MAG TPA: flagellar biosynthesis protein FlhF [Pirellulales bacterium]|jgi:flagellar biosynthesis protein FlhF|nr:flagellar biosynthesis protein FlhF [Pirellulales bacterium]
MDVKTYRARTMQEALNLVRRELGPNAAVLQTRDVRTGGLFRLLPGMRRVEVTASADVTVPSRMPSRTREADFNDAAGLDLSSAPRPDSQEYRRKFRDELQGQLTDLHSMVEDLCRRSQSSPPRDLPRSLFHLFTDLIEADVSEELARELIERIRGESPGDDLADEVLAKARIARMVEDEIQVTGPIRAEPGRRRLVALVGPTGVGKTTTIAKLAANFRLKEKRKVGLITVDTYRIAAVEQLRTYADIIDLPMAVVSTPREMRDAVARMRDLELILMDTAGRSPRDEVKIQELKSMLSEAAADEVHLVLSSTAGAASLVRTAGQFAAVGATTLVLTKLDEVNGLGNLLPLLRSCKLPLSYVTDGQNVPDDIEPADRRKLARMVLGMEV